MADAVATQKISDGGKFATFKFTNVSDGSGESAVAKVDVSALSKDPVTGQSCSKVSILGITYSTVGMSVKVFFNASTDVLVWHCIADYSDTLDFSGGVNGDVNFTTVGHSNTDTYCIVLKLLKHYG